MNKIERFKKLLMLSRKLGNAIDLVSPTRELIKEGKVKKITAHRDNDHQDRYLYLVRIAI